MTDKICRHLVTRKDLHADSTYGTLRSYLYLQSDVGNIINRHAYGLKRNYEALLRKEAGSKKDGKYSEH